MKRLVRIAASLALVLVLTGLGQAVGGHRVTITWQPVTTYTNGQPLPAQVCYVIYKSSDGQNWTVLASDVALTTTSITDTNVFSGKTYWYKVTVYDSTKVAESADSNIAQAVIP